MRELEAESIHSVVTDPPYGLSFMGKEWDHGIPGKAFWIEALRVAKPGAHLLAFGGTRTYHRLACAIEDAGWEIRDCVMWVYGSGFPKSHNLDGEWKGWGTALKPAWEPIIVARKPLVGTVAENVAQHGTGAINVDGCRVEHSEPIKPMKAQVGGDKVYGQSGRHEDTTELKANGRWPANLIHDGSDEVVGLFPVTTSGVWSGQLTGRGSEHSGDWGKKDREFYWQGDSGSAARFFYCAKASKADRDKGCEGLLARVAGVGDVDEASGRDSTKPGNQYRESSRKRVEAGLPPTMPRHNHHPTVKPTALMRYLCRLVTPPGGIVLDPFMGSGSTGKAAVMEGFDFIGIEKESEYLHIAEARIKKAKEEKQEQLL